MALAVSAAQRPAELRPRWVPIAISKGNSWAWTGRSFIGVPVSRPKWRADGGDAPGATGPGAGAAQDSGLVRLIHQQNGSAGGRQRGSRPQLIILQLQSECDRFPGASGAWSSARGDHAIAAVGPGGPIAPGRRPGRLGFLPRPCGRGQQGRPAAGPATSGRLNR